MKSPAAADSLRLDKWLWYARFFKTRANATRAISGGRFRLDGEVMSKPHRAAQPGQVLTFTQGERVRVIRIVALGTRRGPASEAVELYEDLSPEMPKRRAESQTSPVFESREKGAGRPTKRDRRATQQLKTELR
ncbi:MAG: RNA-binding S4 domain-containing protein [Pseudomonadota bacterium]|nr:RNA-binding S4 domain-containing protein [Pseudomonadota bacterium]MEC7094600.1 RNA-binding S4 domain-containing protein [Pseudomonadota bacterium]MEC7494512.1 RNA-binding S4 domain-containing protein [Pseudomonadota bacterium]MEC7558730.1 RNA-binding S4 domain-containing protein [Pseudomonadota bacterium]MEC7651873.1 RNA-binding S4 domain-containing protein [Pseudomonadota bacterium]